MIIDNKLKYYLEYLNNNNLILTGSLALQLQGYKLGRKINDLDVLANNNVEIKVPLSTSMQTFNYGGGFITNQYNILDEDHNSFKLDVFHKDSPKIHEINYK